MSRLQYVNEEKLQEDGRAMRRVTLEDSGTGLHVIIEFTLYPEHRSIVYGARLVNRGTTNIEHLTSLHSYDLHFQPLQTLMILVDTCGGGAEVFSSAGLAVEAGAPIRPEEVTLESGTVTVF